MLSLGIRKVSCRQAEDYHHSKTYNLVPLISSANSSSLHRLSAPLPTIFTFTIVIMMLSVWHWLISCTILLAATCASQSNSGRNVVPTADLADASIEDEKGLEDWLATHKRAPVDALHSCPSSCLENSGSASGWFLYPDPASLAACNETMLLDLAVQNDNDGQHIKLTIRACMADYSSGNLAFNPDEETAALCSTPNHVLIETHVSMAQVQVDGDDKFAVDDLISAGSQVVNYLGSRKPSCSENVLNFGYSQSSVIGVFAGAEVHQHGVTAEVLKRFLEYAKVNTVSKASLVQLCGLDGRGADYSIGIISSGVKNLALVQEAVKTWADGRCVSGLGQETDWMTVTIRVPSVQHNSDEIVTSENATTPAHLWSRSRLSARAECKTTTVKAGDGCWALAQRCKITEANLKTYNTRSNFCTTLVVDEKVCCSSGTLPDTIPPANSDGTCKIGRVIGGDSCATLASKCGLTPRY